MPLRDDDFDVAGGIARGADIGVRYGNGRAFGTGGADENGIGFPDVNRVADFRRRRAEGNDDCLSRMRGRQADGTDHRF